MRVAANLILLWLLCCVPAYAEPLQLEVTVNKVPYAPVEPTPADPELAPATLKDVRLKFDALQAKHQTLLERLINYESNSTSKRQRQYEHGVCRFFVSKNTADVGKRVNDVIADMQARFQPWGKELVLHGGLGPITSPINLDQNIAGGRIVLRGTGYMNPTLEMPHGPDHHFIAIDARNSRELNVRHLRVIESVGDPVDRCCCIAVGGTSAKVTDCWFGNAKIGILTTGAGTILDNNNTEFCRDGLLVTTRYFDSSLGIKPATANTRNLKVDTHQLYKTSVTIRNYLHVNVEVTKGEVKAGDTLIMGEYSVPILDIHDNTLLVSRVDALNEAGKVISTGVFETSAGARGKIVSRQGNLLSNIDIDLMCEGQNDNGKPIVTAEGADSLTLKMTANGTNGALLRHVRCHDITAMMTNSLSPTRMEKCEGFEPRFQDPKFPEIEVVK